MMVRDVRMEDCWPGCEKQHEHGKSDVPRIREIFSQQIFEYGEPDWTQLMGKVLVDDSGTVQIALLARKTVEMYALVSGGNWAAPGMKATQFQRLDEAVRIDLKQQGYTDQHCWVPPICKAFARRLQRYFGWVQSSDPAEPWLGLVRKI
jgi:hypothetical protein